MNISTKFNHLISIQRLFLRNIKSTVLLSITFNHCLSSQLNAHDVESLTIMIALQLARLNSITNTRNNLIHMTFVTIQWSNNCKLELYLKRENHRFNRCFYGFFRIFKASQQYTWHLLQSNISGSKTNLRLLNYTSINYWMVFYVIFALYRCKPTGLVLKEVNWDSNDSVVKFQIRNLSDLGSNSYGILISL